MRATARTHIQRVRRASRQNSVSISRRKTAGSAPFILRERAYPAAASKIVAPSANAQMRIVASVKAATRDFSVSGGQLECTANARRDRRVLERLDARVVRARAVPAFLPLGAARDADRREDAPWTHQIRYRGTPLRVVGAAVASACSESESDGQRGAVTVMGDADAGGDPAYGPQTPFGRVCALHWGHVIEDWGGRLEAPRRGGSHLDPVCGVESRQAICSTQTRGIGLPPVAVAAGRRHPSNGCRARSVSHFRSPTTARPRHG
ncbi:hypothetical protein B0H17DRAFT_1275662 [Mycena rosella]|uniref:Uncharacterized protein n=1 Tax=Mycena rosella TaxID=1033263 RepID=A0AAD7C6J6_MYCRO|nr:hypothetical protein B0H17DRAFT_1275662 [Mycena rosella]